MFPLTRENGEPVDAGYAKTRMKWEPVTEATQIKGDSETYPSLSPGDRWADFETFPFVLTPEGLTPDPTEGDYIRAALRRGLELEQQLGVNPYKTGMIGSTDSHTGIGAVEEDNFAGKGQHDALPEDRSHPTGLGATKRYTTWPCPTIARMAHRMWVIRSTWKPGAIPILSGMNS
jgi:hypothetical protein